MSVDIENMRSKKSPNPKVSFAQLPTALLLLLHTDGKIFTKIIGLLFHSYNHAVKLNESIDQQHNCLIS